MDAAAIGNREWDLGDNKGCGDNGAVRQQSHLGRGELPILRHTSLVAQHPKARL
jgi:hypothetical protein